MQTPMKTNRKSDESEEQENFPTNEKKNRGYDDIDISKISRARYKFTHYSNNRLNQRMFLSHHQFF